MAENQEDIKDNARNMEFIDTGFYGFDWNGFYNSNEWYLVEEALTDIGFNLFAQRFHDELVDYTSFMHLQPHNISKILHDVPTGIQIKFEKAYEEWKLLNSSDISSQVNKQLMQQPVNFKITPGFVKGVLESTDAGNDFISEVNKAVPFDTFKRNKLIKLINAYCADKKIVLGVEQVKDISYDIKNLFPHELASYYFEYKNGKASGALYTAHNNMLQKLRKNNLMPSTLRKRKHENTVSTSVESLVREYTKEELQSNEFVKKSTANIPFETLREHWRKSAKIRLDTYRKENGKDISTLYRVMERPDSFLMIDIDFQELFPSNDANFRNEWNLTETKLVQVLLKEVKQKNQIDLLKKIGSLSANQKVAVIISSLHFFLYTPTVIRQSNYRSTILDTLECMLFRAESEATKDLNVKEWQNRMKERKLTSQAYIVGFGKSHELLTDKFCVKVDDLQYTFEGENALLDALEILLKIYHVIDLEYPVLNSNVYAFLSTKFLKVPCNDKNASLKINQLVNQL